MRVADVLQLVKRLLVKPTTKGSGLHRFRYRHVGFLSRNEKYTDGWYADYERSKARHHK